MHHVRLQGGGWCRSLEDCAGRSTTDLGTSKAYTANKTAAEMQSQSGAMVRDPASNPQVRCVPQAQPLPCLPARRGQSPLCCRCCLPRA
jgi:hypothetical protein